MLLRGSRQHRPQGRAAGVPFDDLAPGQHDHALAGDLDIFHHVGREEHHAPLGHRVLAAGRALFCEKPLTVDLAAAGPTSDGYVAAFPCGQPRHDAATLNYTSGITTGNSTTVKIGDNGKICLYTLATTHLLVDINGAFEPNSGFTPLTPARILETRAGFSTVDGQHNNTGVVAAGVALGIGELLAGLLETVPSPLAEAKRLASALNARP